MSTPERRLTQFPGSSSIVSLGKRGAGTEPEGRRLSASKIPRVLEALHSHQRIHPPPIPLKANPNSLQFSISSRFQKKSDDANHQREAICYKGNPWQVYYAILKEDQAGQVTLAYKMEVEHPFFAVKELGCKDTTLIKYLTKCSHKNIVSLYEAYLENLSLYLVYEPVDVSLAEIQSTQYGKLATFQIAAVCREVVNGIQYVHNELRILHGSISAETVMVSKNGSVKLANIGESMLKHVAKTENEQKDFRDLGLLMVQLMELGTSLQSPGTFVLQDPGKWDESIKSFLQKTQHSTGAELQKDVFLEHSPDSHCLKPLVLITERSIYRSCDICME